LFRSEQVDGFGFLQQLLDDPSFKGGSVDVFISVVYPILGDFRLQFMGSYAGCVNRLPAGAIPPHQKAEWFNAITLPA